MPFLAKITSYSFILRKSLNMIPKLGSSSTNNILFLLFMCNYLVNVFNCIVNLLPLPTALSTVIFPL